MQQNPIHDREVKLEEMFLLFEGKIDLDRMIPSCIACAQVIETLGEYNGPEKLSLLQKVLRIAVEKSVKSVVEKEHLLHVIESAVPMIVQAALMASKSPIVAQVEATCVGCWTKK